jgi:hypothetical protein
MSELKRMKRELDQMQRMAKQIQSSIYAQQEMQLVRMQQQSQAHEKIDDKTPLKVSLVNKRAKTTESNSLQPLSIGDLVRKKFKNDAGVCGIVTEIVGNKVRVQYETNASKFFSKQDMANFEYIAPSSDKGFARNVCEQVDTNLNTLATLAMNQDRITDRSKTKPQTKCIRLQQDEIKEDILQLEPLKPVPITTSLTTSNTPLFKLDTIKNIKIVLALQAPKEIQLKDINIVNDMMKRLFEDDEIEIDASGSSVRLHKAIPPLASHGASLLALSENVSLLAVRFHSGKQPYNLITVQDIQNFKMALKMQ